MALRNVIIIGAGGHLGPSILSAFRGDSRFNVSVLSRQSSTSKFPEDTKVHRVGDDYPDDEVLSAFKGQDAIVSTIATASAGQQIRFIDLAIKAGETPQAIQAQVGELIRCVPQHLLYKSLDGMFKEWRLEASRKNPR